jgi:flagellar biosynthesis protein FliR
MNIFSVGFPITIIAGLVMLMVSVPNLSGGMAGLLEEVTRRMREAVMAGRG